MSMKILSFIACHASTNGKLVIMEHYLLPACTVGSCSSFLTSL